jgi:Phenylalanyl-tRNA synthetase beta subunit
MYDADKLENNELIVKDDFAGSIFAFDNKEYKIEKGDLVITNNDKVVCLAGIMTAKNAEIESKTTNIVIECANFYGAQIRKTSIRIGLLTDSAQRFIKGINPNQNEEVLDLITHFIKEICGYKNCTKTSKYDVLAYKAKEIYCSYSYINNRLGTDFSDEIIIDTLKKLYFGIKNVTKEGFIAVVPDSRIDVEGKADLSEEILRYNGFDSIKSILPIMETTIGGRSEISKKTKIISDYLLNNGLDRINDYTLINEEDVHSFNLLNSNEALQILHPLTEDHKFLRTNLLSSMLRTIEYNANYRNKNFGLFEISQINDKKESSLHLSIGLFGKKFEQDQLGGKDYNFYDAKGYFESICKMFGIQFNRLRYEKLTGSTELHPNKSCKVTLDGKLFAIFGELYPTLKEKYNFKKENIVLFEMNLTILFNSKSTFEHFVEVNKYPSISRDYAFVINKDLNYGEIKSQIKKLSSLISDIHIFDIYSGEHLINNKVSIAINVTFESFDHTLIDEEVNAVNDEIVELLKSKFDATMRS